MLFGLFRPFTFRPLGLFNGLFYVLYKTLENEVNDTKKSNEPSKKINICRVERLYDGAREQGSDDIYYDRV